MKKSTWKKLLAALLALAMVFALAACGGNTGGQETQNPGGGETNTQAPDDQGGGDENPPAPANGGTIMWLSNLTSGTQYDAAVNYAKAICAKLGYNFQVVYADGFNDPAGNLSAVQTGMTSDVVAIIASQDGGIQNIMEEYPDLYVVGFNSDMAAVYNEGGAAAGLLSNDHWLGTIVDGYADGKNAGHDYAQAVINQGYHKVATMIFPFYAYPMLQVADQAFRAEIAEYNQTASEPIEIVGDTKMLEFAPLEESWFMENSGYQDLDAIVGFLAGVQFIYPTMKSAMANGLCSADTKLVTSGFETAADIIADMGGDGVIQYVDISPIENIAWAITLLDNALQGKQYADFSPDCIDSARYVIDSKEDIDNVMAKSLNGTTNADYAQISLQDLETVLTRYNPDATYAQLNELFHSEQITVDGLK